MARQARGEYLNPDEIQVVHAVQRCVRQAFLCAASAILWLHQSTTSVSTDALARLPSFERPKVPTTQSVRLMTVDCLPIRPSVWRWSMTP